MIDPFQSTPPVKAATQHHTEFITLLRISIHAAREGGDLLAVYARKVKPISIHAAREGGDIAMSLERYIRDISIHAAREGGDNRNNTFA